MTDDTADRAPQPVARLTAIIRDTPLTWSLCGGWAVDAWVGRQTRNHLDVDVAVFRDEERAIFEHLAHLRLVAHDTADAVHDEPWDGRPLNFPAHIHSTLGEDLPWELQLNERSATHWLLRREPRVAVPLPLFAPGVRWGLPIMAPEILLWYKALDVRPHDELDFEALVPKLSASQRHWLADAIARVDLVHPWLRPGLGLSVSPREDAPTDENPPDRRSYP